METKHTEFEEMRQQLDILKNKLDNQTLVNDKLIRQSMLNKMSFMKKYTWVSFLVLLFIYYGYNEVRILFNLSWWFYGFTVLVMTYPVFLKHWAIFSVFCQFIYLADNIRVNALHTKI